MKHLKRRLMSLLLVLTMVATVVPTALAWDDDLYVSAYRDYPNASGSTVYMDTDEEEEFGVEIDLKDDGYTVDSDDYDLYDIDYEWTLYDEYDDVYYDDWDIGYDEYCVIDDLDEGSYELVCEVSVYDDYDNDSDYDEVTWYIEVDDDGYWDDEDIELSTDEDDYFYFDDDSTDEGYSVQEMIEDLLDNNYYSDTYYVDFDDDGGDADLCIDDYSDYSNFNYVDLDDLDELYLDIDSYAEKWEGSYTVYDNDDDKVLEGYITIYFDGTGSYDDEDIELTTDADDYFYFDDDDTDENYSVQEILEDLLDYNYSNDSYIIDFDDLSGDADLCVDDDYDYDYDEIDLEDLDEVYLDIDPYAEKWSGSYTVYEDDGDGVLDSTEDDADDIVLEGDITIYFGEYTGEYGEADDIDYYVVYDSVSLKASDFDAVYKEVTGTTKTPNYTIKFQELPSYGTLYANGTELTSKNYKTKSFTNKTTGTNSISKVTYEPDVKGKNDSVDYTVYSGGKAIYTGTVNFGIKLETPKVTYNCTTGSVGFNPNDFYAGSSLLFSGAVTFGVPANGTLYTGYNGSTGTRVTSADSFYYYATGGVKGIGDITYVPRAGYTGVETISFTSFNGTSTINGTVTINVTAAPVKVNFPDVPTTNWAYDEISRLANAGIIGGRSDGTYGLKDNVTYGEALKMILLAAGYPKQEEPAGSNWAINYYGLAKQYGIVTDNNVNLSAKIDRNTIAAITAKALGISPASSVKAGIVKPTDTTDGYVYAMYNAGILNGVTTNGVNRFDGKGSFIREQMAAVVCRIMDYKSY